MSVCGALRTSFPQDLLASKRSSWTSRQGGSKTFRCYLRTSTGTPEWSPPIMFGMNTRARALLFCCISLLLTMSPRDAAPAPGQHRVHPDLLVPHLVPIEPGRRLNFHCVGKGSPTVVFEQGGEGMIFNWAAVQPAIAKRTKTCAYDRGGFGWSDQPRFPVTAMSVTDDLHMLLKRAGVRGRVILVGHSIGGFYATMYANRFLPTVAGLVLVDPGFSGQSSGATAERWDIDQANIRRGEGYLLRCAELGRRGALNATNLTANRCFELPMDAQAPVERRYALRAITGPGWYEAEHSQSVNYFSADRELSVSHAQERLASRSFGDLPMVVLSAGHFPNPGWRTPEENRTYQARWLQGHKDLAARSSRGRLEIVPSAGHFIQKDEPDAVIKAIFGVLEEARQYSPGP